MLTESLYVAGIERCSTVDGPGLRDVLFLAGCSKEPKCLHCQNPHLWDKYAGRSTHNAMLYFQFIDYVCGKVGLTVSGGEPTDQILGLYTFLHALNADRKRALRMEKDIPKKDVIVYTYLTIDALTDLLFNSPKNSIMCIIPNIVNEVSYWVTGEYDKSKPPTKFAGSSNQEVWQFADSEFCLTTF